MTRFVWWWCFLLLYVNAEIPIQAPNCNDCYATTSYEIIKHYYKTSNVTVNDLMQQTRQGCAGGNPQKILHKYFRGTKVNRGGLYKIIQLIKKGPLIIDLTDQHLVTAWKATSNGILIHDTRDGTQKILTRDNHNLKFKFILNVVK